MKNTSLRLLLIGLNTLLGATGSFAQTPITDLEATGTTKIEGPLQIDDTGTGAAPGLWYVQNMHEGFYFFDDPNATDQFVPDFQGDERVFFWHPDKMALRMGDVHGDAWDASSLGNYSVAFGSYSAAIGDNSFSAGDKAYANNWVSIALGEYVTSNGIASFAAGTNTQAINDQSTAFGFYTIASGNISTAFGLLTVADSMLSTVIGYRNIGGGDPDLWIDTDPLFEIGNGHAEDLSNALTTLKNGQTTLDNRFWDEQNPVVVPTSTDASQGEALVVNGHARLRGLVILEQAQGDISMGSFQ